MRAVIYKHGDDDFEIWFPDLPPEAMLKIEAILEEYNDSGFSVRGAVKEIMDELN